MALISFLIILSLLILVHELGHFVAAKRFKIKVEEFGFGYPPRLAGIKKKGTIYSLNWLPFGGFVRMRGEDIDSGQGSFSVQKKRVRLLVLFSGVVMNFVFGVLLFAAIYTKIGIPEKVDYLLVTTVASHSPAEAAGIKPGDKLTGYQDMEEFISYVNSHRGESVSFTIVNENVRREMEIIPRTEAETPEGEGALGVAITNVDTIFYPIWQRPFRGMWVGLKEALGWGKEILTSLTKINAKNVAGPVGIYQISKSASQEGLLAILQFMGILSVNLAILNLLPLPALDGGRLVFVGIEAITRRRVKPKLEQMVHLIGMAFLIALMILVTFNDLRRLVK